MGTNRHDFLPEFLKMAIGSDDYYKDSPHWTKFELDLIDLIKNYHSIIYSNVENLDKNQRAVKISETWKVIGSRFKEIPVGHLRMKWKSIVTCYYKIKNNNEWMLPKYRKFTNGTFSFLNDHLDFCIQDLNENACYNENPSFDSMTFPLESTSANVISGALCENSVSSDTIRQLVHEEVNLDEENGEVKMEVEIDENNHNGIFTNSTEEFILPDNNFIMEDTTTNKDSEPQKKWDEEELLNSTHLTKEMIEELLRIKLKQYYTDPVITE